MRITAGQYNRLAELFIDIAKAMMIAAFAVHVVSDVPLATSSYSVIVGGLFVYLSLFAEKRKEDLL